MRKKYDSLDHEAYTKFCYPLIKRSRDEHSFIDNDSNVSTLVHKGHNEWIKKIDKALPIMEKKFPMNSKERNKYILETHIKFDNLGILLRQARQQQSSSFLNGHSITRIKTVDLYDTPRLVIEELLKREHLGGDIWECASGNGAISKVLEEKGYSVFSSDIRTENVYGTGGVDFLKENREVDCIITNPPFSLITEFAEHALKCARKKVVLFARIEVSWGKKRYEKVWRDNPPTREYVFMGHISCLLDGKQITNKMIHVWLVWDKESKKTGFTELYHINSNVKMPSRTQEDIWGDSSDQKSE